MATYPNILVWRTPWTGEPGGPQSPRSQSLTQLSDWAHNTVKSTLHSCSSIHALSLSLFFVSFLFIDVYRHSSVATQQNAHHWKILVWEYTQTVLFLFHLWQFLLRNCKQIAGEASADLRLYTQARWQSPAATQKVLLARDDRWTHMETSMLLSKSQAFLFLFFCFCCWPTCVPGKEVQW